MRNQILPIRRSELLRLVAGGAFSLLMTGEAVAAESKLGWISTAETISGPFKSIGERLSREARGRVGKGGEAQLLLDDFLLQGDRTAPAAIYRLARNGDDKARTVLGYMLDNNVGAPKNHALAAENFALAAPKDELARYNLGVLLLNGRGVQENPTKAMSHFMQVKRVPYVFVLMSLHALDLDQKAIALDLAEKAHNRKDEYGTYLFARLLIEQGESVKGAKLMQSAARAGVLEAIASMVYLTENGIGLPANNGMAIGWWVISEVTSGRATLDDALESAERFNLSNGELGVARRFSSKWLMNYVPRVPFDYTKTLTYSDLDRSR